MLQTLINSGVVAILRGVTPEEARGAVAAFAKAGLLGIEVTFNTPGAAEIIADLSKRHPELCLGAGTVLTEENVACAADAGARFILSPDTNPDVIRATKARGLISIPGAYTPTEVLLAIRSGADMVKIFPAGAAGPAYIKDVLGPLNTASLMAVGGVTAENTAAFMRAGCNTVGVGSNLVNRELIRQKKWDDLTALAKRFLEEVKAGRHA